jgi:hypothetical protein
MIDDDDIEVYEKEEVAPENNNIELSIKEVVSVPESIVLEAPKIKKSKDQSTAKPTKKLKQKMVIEE